MHRFAINSNLCYNIKIITVLSSYANYDSIQ